MDADLGSRPVGAVVGAPKRTVLRGFSWNALAQLASAVASLAVVPYLINGLGLDQYGIFALATTTLFLLLQVDGGLATTAIRYFTVYAGADDRKATAELLTTFATIILLLGGGIAAVLFVFVPDLLRDLFNFSARYQSEGIVLFRAIAILLPLSLLQALFQALLQSRDRYRFLSLATIFTFGLRTAGLVESVRLGHHILVHIAFVLVGQQVLGLIINVVACSRYVGFRELSFVDLPTAKEMCRYCFHVQIFSISALVNMQADALIIGVISPLRDVGFYSTGANFAVQLRAVLSNALFPAVTRLGTAYGAGGEEQALSEFTRLQSAWVTVNSAFFAIALSTGYFAITAWLGPRFQIAGVVCVILLGGYFLNMLTGMLTLYLQSIGRPEIEMRYGVIGMLINLGLTVPLAFFGMIGVVAATAAGLGFGSIYLLRIVHKRVSGDVPSFLHCIPVRSFLLTAAVTFTTAYLLHGSAPVGVLGLLFSAIPAVPGAIVFALSHYGLRHVTRKAMAYRRQAGWGRHVVG